jgi:hypothetical protein
MVTTAEYLENIKAELDDAWLPFVYRERILKSRTRAYRFPRLAANARIEIHHTLLGIELKAGRRRMLCPDLATARYLSVFARLGCRAAAIPYDITKISLMADELESSWHRTLLIADQLTNTQGDAFRARVRRQIIAKVREEVEAAGAGPRVPQFKQSTKQRTEPQSNKRESKRTAAHNA